MTRPTRTTSASVVVALALAVAASAVAAGPPLVGRATKSGPGAVALLAVSSYTKHPVRTYRYTVTTKPARMLVLVRPAARTTRPSFVTRAPVTRTITCSRPCPLTVSAQLWASTPAVSRGRLPRGAVTIRAWKLR
jgi:hypothetical protein